MNDDRKFQERAEIMKQLFLARIPTDVIAKVAGVSETTVANDRVRVAKLYGIKIPGAASTSLERGERFMLLLKTYLTVKFKTREWKDPVYQAAKLLINFDRIDSHISSLERFYEGLQHPQFSSDNSIAIGYQQLIEDCLEDEHCYFTREFYEAIYSGTIPCENIRNDGDLIELATKFCLSKNRNSINTLIINDPKTLVNSLFSELTEVHITALREKYGLDCPRKTLDGSGKEHGLTGERIRQIRQKALYIFRNELTKKKYLVHSTAKYERLEKRYAELDEKYKKYCEETDNEIILLKSENAKLHGIFEKNDAKLDTNNYPAYFKVLISPIKWNFDLPARIVSALAYKYDFIVDAIEDWDNLVCCRNFGKKSYMAFDEYLLDHGIDRHKLTLEERVFARQLIKREK
jgi:hypothetical protein